MGYVDWDVGGNGLEEIVRNYHDSAFVVSILFISLILIAAGHAIFCSITNEDRRYHISCVIVIRAESFFWFVFYIIQEEVSLFLII